MSNPTINAKGSKFWLNKNNKYHRLNGPAIEWNNGDKYWYINGKIYGKKDYFKELEKFSSKQEIFLMRLKYC